jgi:hypothetical protein
MAATETTLARLSLAAPKLHETAEFDFGDQPQNGVV